MYRIDKQNIVLEVFDDEGVLLNISQGKYYSVRGRTILRVLDLLSHPISLGYLKEVISNEYLVNPEILESELKDLINILLSECIVILENNDKTEHHWLTQEFVSKQPYTPLSIEIFDDMQDLIMLDPVHDVEALKGWPYQKNEDGNKM